MGIPLININNKESFDKFAEFMNQKFAIKTSWLLDIQSVNLSEIFGATLGVVALFLVGKNMKKKSLLILPLH